MQLMIAQKRLRYDGILMEPGEQFYVAKSTHVKYLKTTGKAKEGRLQIDEPESVPGHSLKQEYQRVVGKRPYHGWDEDTLREKINTYQRRDMRAE